MARYIDADVLIENLKNQYGEDLGWQCTVNMSDVGMMIEDMSTADVVEVRHGEWVTLEAEIGLYSCSLCEHKILRAECNYCPNCGAKMDGGKAE